jgi:hypothetical protein
MPTDEEVRHFQRYYPESNLMHWYNKGYADALREARRDIGRDFGIRHESDVEQTAQLGPVKVKKRKRNKWVLFLKRFTFRNKRKSESGRKYLALRTRAAARAWKKVKK